MLVNQQVSSKTVLGPCPSRFLHLLSPPVCSRCLLSLSPARLRLCVSVQIQPNKLLGVIGEHDGYPVEDIDVSHDQTYLWSPARVLPVWRLHAGRGPPWMRSLDAQPGCAAWMRSLDALALCAALPLACPVSAGPVSCPARGLLAMLLLLPAPRMLLKRWHAER